VTTVWIAGDCWLKPDMETMDLRGFVGDPRPDILILNLECAIQAGTARTGRGALLPLAPHRLSEIAVAENSVCLMANNHVSDFGAEGLLATLQALRQAGIRPVGAGTSLAKARAPVIVEVGGRRIGLLAYADTAPHVGSVAATDQSPGVAPLIPDMIVSDVRETAKEVDDVWLFLHWGWEFIRYPEPEQRDLARTFAEAGAHLIVGIHPHVMRGKETIANTLVYYSVGNFVFPPIPRVDGSVLRWDRVSRQGLTLKGTLEGDDWRWSEVPCVITEQGRPRLPLAAENSRITREFAELSAPLSDGYSLRYPSMRRREMLRYAASRLWMMSWTERGRRLMRLARAAAFSPRRRETPPGGGVG
jgi:hypothetical protein